MNHLFRPLTLRSVHLKNRIGMSPMCQYSAIEGVITPWHRTHLVTRAVGGVALIMAEASGVSPEGRITLGDAGLWNDSQVQAWKPVTLEIKTYGAVPGIQIAHAGRKASAARPWEGGAHLTSAQGGWLPLAPSAEAWGEKLSRVPKAMTEDDIREVTAQFVRSAHLALAAGFEWLEIHAAHGYLLHSFLSPLSNHRTDAYGGSFENRVRFLTEVTKQVRAAWPTQLPLAVRLSATDWDERGWQPADSVKLGKILKDFGVDLIDCSSGAIAPATTPIPLGPGYQVFLAERVKREANILTAAVGLITEPQQAEKIIATGQADLVFLARELMRDPYWAFRAAKALHENVEAVLPPAYAFYLKEK